MVFCFKHKTAYELRISDWSSDVCSSDLEEQVPQLRPLPQIGSGANRFHATFAMSPNDFCRKAVCKGSPRNCSIATASEPMFARDRQAEFARKSAVEGNSGLGSVDHGGRRNIKK